MATEQFGVEAVVQGLGTFLSSIAKINSSIATIGSQVQATNNQLNLMGATFDRVTQRWRQANGQFASAQSVADNLTKALGGISGSTNDALTGFSQLAGGLGQMTQAAIGTDSELQKKPGDLNTAAKAAEDAGGSFSAFGAIFSTVGTILGGAKDVFDFVIHGVEGFISAIGNAVGAIAGFVAGVAKIAIGVTIGSVIRDMSNAIRQLGSDVVETAAQFQALEVRFTTIAAGDLVKQFGGNVTQYLGQASDSAQQLIEWVRQLALTTASTTLDVGQALGLANAYGLSTRNAQVLTQSVLDFQAALGISSDAVDRIIYDFGQMISQGKITGRELLNLGYNLVPVDTILQKMADRAGITKDAMRQLVTQGGVPVNDFIKEFVNLADTQFSGAAQRMSETIGVALQNIKDLADITLGSDIFGPLSKSIAAGLNEVVNSLKGVDFQTTAEVLGGVLNVAFLGVVNTINTQFVPAINNLMTALGFVKPSADSAATAIAEIGYGIQAAIGLISTGINAIANFITNAFASVIKGGYTYGYNLVAFFAEGMAAAVNLIVQVIGAIANLIAGWFAPHSPPKVASEIDTWGAQTISIYAKALGDNADLITDQITNNVSPAITKGFQAAGNAAQVAGKLTADQIAAQARAGVQGLIDQFGGDAFGKAFQGLSDASWKTFNTISDTVTSFIRSLQDLSIPQEGIVPRILGTREAIANAVLGIQKGTETVAQAIASVMKAIGQAPVGFAKYVQAIFSAASAQSNLSNAQELGNSVLESNSTILSRMTGSVKTAGQAYVDALNKMNAATAASKAAQDSLSQITEQYDAKLKALNDQLNQVTTVYDEQNQLQQINAALASGLLTNDEKKRLENEKQAILLKEQIRQTQAEKDAAVASGQAKVDAAKAAEDAAKKEADARQKYLIELAQAQADAANKQLDAAKSLIDAQTQQNNLIKEQLDLLKSLANAKNAAGGGLGNIGQQIANALNLGTPKTFKLPDQSEITKRINEVMANARAAFESWKDQIKKAIEDGFQVNTLNQIGKKFQTNLFIPIQTAFRNFTTWWNANAKPLFDQFGGVITAGIETLTGALGNLNTAISNLGGGKGGKGGDTLTLLLGVLLGLAGGIISTGILILSGVINGLAFAIQTANNVISIFQPLFTQMVLIWNEAVAAFNNAPDVFGKVAAALQLVGVAILDLVVGAFLVAAEIVGAVLGAIIGFVVGFVSSVIGWFQHLADQLVGHSIVPDMMNSIHDTIVNGINGVLDSIKKWVDDVIAEFTRLYNQATTWITTTWTNISTTVSTKTKEILATVETWISDQIKKIEGSVATMKQAADNVWTGVKKSIQSVIDTIVNVIVPKMIKDTETAISGAYNKLYNAVQIGFKGLSNGVKHMADVVYGIIQNAIKSWINLIANIHWPSINIPNIFGGGGGGGGGTGNTGTGNTGGGRQGGCFVYETPVATPTGVTPIGELHDGAKIVMLTRSGERYEAEIYDHHFVVRDDLVTVELSDGAKITCSPNHRFKRKGGAFAMAQDLAEGDVLVGLDGNKTVVNVLPFDGLMHKVYNFTVDHPEHTYVVEGVVVHNLKQEASGSNFTGGWTLVGEQGPEMLNLPTGGQLFNASKTQNIISSLSIIANTFAQAYTLAKRVNSNPIITGANNSRNVTVNVNASYSNTQSPVDIYWDISAALQSARL